MTPSEYEAAAADRFTQLGYAFEDRPGTNDWGIDLTASNLRSETSGPSVGHPVRNHRQATG